MNCKKTLLALIACMLFFGTALAADQPINSATQQGPQSNTGNSVQSQIRMPGSMDFGIPQQSFASPEYVAQEKMLESMTTAYNWITLNSARFAKGCKEDKPALVNEITAVLSKAEETSTVCSSFAKEAKTCSPKTFCAKFRQGKLPLPQNMISILQKLGYDTGNLKVEDFTTDLIAKVCVEQRSANNSEQTSMMEAVKQKIQSQLPEFRKKCELLSQTKGMAPDVMLPNIDIRPQMQPTNMMQQASNQPMQPMQGTQGGACREPHPDCYPLPPPTCRNGTWVCEGTPQTCGPNQHVENNTCVPNPVDPNYCQGTAPPCSPGPPFCQNGQWQCPPSVPTQPSPQPQPPTEPAPSPAPSEPAPVPAPSEPAPAPAPPAPAPVPEVPATTSPIASGSNLITGFVNLVTGLFEETQCPAGQHLENGICIADLPATTLPPIQQGPQTIPNNSVCGNTICEPGLGENNSNCPQDCMPDSGSNQQMPFGQNPNQQPQGQQGPSTSCQGQAPNCPQGANPFCENGSWFCNQNGQKYNWGPDGYGQVNPNTGPSNNQGQPGNFMMPGPEQLCKMTDEEIISVYTEQMQGPAPSADEIQYQCEEQAQRELGNISRFKMEIARCEADSALDCEAKKEALNTCNEMKSTPEKVAGVIVDSMCRRFGVTSGNSANEALYTVAEKWANSDPALSNQLGDTADQVGEAKKQLDMISYVFGNGTYAEDLSQKAAELRTVRQKLASSGVSDQETLSTLDSQAKQLESESGQFKNLIDFGRLMQMFSK